MDTTKKTYAIDLTLPATDLAELIETLQTIGAVESLQFTIEADSRREAVRETEELLEDFAATYRGAYRSSRAKTALGLNLSRVIVPRTTSPLF